MQRLQFREIVEVVNRTGTVQIEAVPFDERPGLWTLHKGTVLSGGLEFHCALLYVYADATRDGLESGKDALRGLQVPKAQRQVVVAESKLHDVAALLDEFQSLCGSALSTTDYLRACIKQQLDVYVDSIKALSHPHYIPPDIEPLSPSAIASPSTRRHALVDSFATTARGANPLIHVLIAEPGHGKTFFSRHLSQILLRFGFVPLFIESRQWAGLTVDDLSALWKTVAHTFRALRAPIPIVDGYEESFLRVCLKANLFRLVFDGFDEYVLKTIGHVDALEVMETLLSMSTMTGTPILITSRSSFWDSEVAPRLGEIAQSVRVFQMKPFTENQAERYLERRFPQDQAKIDSGVRLFAELRRKTSKGGSDFVGRGFFLPLVADLTEQDSHELGVDLRDVTATQWVIAHLCGREILAHRLPLTVEQQLSLFTEYAELILAGEAPTLENLRLVLETTPGLNRDDIDALTGKASERSLRVHPLLRVDTASNEIVFASEQVFHSLLCEALLRGCEQSGHESIRAVLGARNLTAAVLSQLAESLVDHVAEIHRDPEAFAARIRPVIASIKECNGHLSRAHALNAAAMSSSIAVAAVSRMFAPKSNKQSKTRALLELLGVETFTRLHLTGTLGGYDLRGAGFEDCEFEGVTWFGCVFDSGTRFMKCSFRANRVLACTGFGECEWTGCELDNLSNAAFRAEQIRAKRVPYTGYDLRHDLRQLCRKFVDGGRFSDVHVSELTKGALAFSIHREKIVDSAKRHLLERVESAGAETYTMKPSEREAVQFFLDNGVPAGKVQSVVKDLSKALEIKS